MLRQIPVLIPLNSGLVFTAQKLITLRCMLGLNPFEFRAGIYWMAEYHAIVASRLNPFEFRAGIYWLHDGNYALDTDRLNPFEFRAGIYCRDYVSPYVTTVVLIPLNSGLVFTESFHPVLFDIMRS